MKLSYKNRNIILLCIGFLFIGFGVVQIIFKIKMDEKISSYIQDGFLVLAVVIFFMGKKKDVEEDKEDEETKDDK